ncbi:MobF family relaxase, partial [Rhodococcus pyridinivorans]
AAYARSCEQQMHAFIDSYTTTALERSAPWITAIGQRGTDPRRVRLWESTVREIAISRVLADAPADENDPMAYLREARKTTIAANIERLNRPTQATDEVVGPYSRYTDAELTSARMVSQRRLTEDAVLLSLAQEELDRARGEMSATGAVERSLAQVEIDARNIAEVRAARARLDALTRSPKASTQQITAARAAVAAAEQAAPPERRWPVIERGAQHYRAAEAAKARARATDERTIGRITDRITRLEESITAERTIIGQIETEITRRQAGGTDFTTGQTATPTQTDSAANHQIDRDLLEPDTGPERDL